ncbi:phage baseplate assembly protein V [Streptomyces sp. ME02-8801-2C]|uniref:phage baseplate assembly protein V n=1 Tax=Streptomyces sp. ME02-8801-2C TaxID=3028680 RepID=UPI0029AA9739|nr:phage baseplate assembly protein V [Streptomyces sp. ME02-8801-2C]MDX3452472.1 phage baseplate assembly protein V [Streptomyces sp. ME02-8801-2C]
MPTDGLSRHMGRYYGKYRGEVVDNNDPKNQGTLTVLVPTIFRGTAVAAAACMPYGHFFVPPVGARVWVEFEAGDPQSPLWVGVWHPEGSTPPETQVSPPERRVIQTRSGHTIEIDDTEGEERVLIRHSGDAFVSIDHNGSVLLANQQGSHLHLDAENGTTTLVEQHGNHLVMGEKGTALVNPDGTTLNVAGDTVHVSAAKIVLDATTVAVGSGAREAVVLKSGFEALWKAVVAHTHPTPQGTATASLDLATVLPKPGTHFSSAVVVK